MDVNAPKLRKLTALSEQRNFLPNVNLWEISVHPEDDLVWSIVCSYLISKDFKPPENLPDRLKVLTKDLVEEKAVEEAIESFNPFKCKYSCFKNDSMKKVIHDFKVTLKWDNLCDITQKFNAASSLLKRRICVITDDVVSDIILTHTDNIFEEVETIVLFSSIEEGRQVYSFGVDANYCVQKRKEALFDYLEHCLEHEFFRRSISSIKSFIRDDEDVLISLLKSSLRYTVPRFLESLLLISIITELGYTVDVRSVDSNGLSALYYALMSCDAHICESVYYFAIKGFQFDGSFRIPTPETLSYAKEMKEVLLNDQMKSNNFNLCENPETIEILFHSLFNVNKFVIEVEENLLDFKKEIDELEKSPNDRMKLASKERDKMVSILKTYLKYSKSIEVSDNDISLTDLNGYVKYTSYCNLIDLLSCFIFFDNIQYLKDRLPLPGTYPDIESEFFVHILLNKILNFKKNSGNFKIFHSFTDINIKFRNEVVFKIRNTVLESIEKFCNDLDKVDFENENVKKMIEKTDGDKSSEEYHSILNSYEEIKDYLRVRRLKYYLNVNKLMKNNLCTESVLAVERVLQVLGESILVKSKNKKCAQWFLNLFLPKDFGKQLKDLRNDLSHYKRFRFSAKLFFEKEMCTFLRFMYKVDEICEFLHPFFTIMDLHIKAYAFKKLEYYLPEKYRMQRNIHCLVNCIPEITLETCYPDIRKVFSILLKRIDDQNANRLKCEEIYALSYPLMHIIKSVQVIKHPRDEDLLQRFSIFFRIVNTANDNPDALKNFLNECRSFVKDEVATNEVVIGEYITDEGVIQEVVTPEEIVDDEICEFRNNLHYAPLSKEEKENIMKEIPQFVRTFVSAKKTLKNIQANGEQSVSLETRKRAIVAFVTSFNFSLWDYYQTGNVNDTVDIFSIPDPVSILKEAISEGIIEEKVYRKLCRLMQFSNETSKILQKLCIAHQTGEIKLSALLNRIVKMEEILITSHIEISRLWFYDKGKRYEMKFFEKVLNCYQSKPTVKASIEMLFLDCMEIFRKREKEIIGKRDYWLKTSGMYAGINLRNVIAHGDVLLENLCELLDPKDLSSEILKNVVNLIRDKDCVEALLKLYNEVDKDISKLEKIIKNQTNENYSSLLEPILKCGDSEALLKLHNEIDKEISKLEKNIKNQTNEKYGSLLDPILKCDDKEIYIELLKQK